MGEREVASDVAGGGTESSFSFLCQPVKEKEDEDNGDKDSKPETPGDSGAKVLSAKEKETSGPSSDTSASLSATSSPLAREARFPDMNDLSNPKPPTDVTNPAGSTSWQRNSSSGTLSPLPSVSLQPAGSLSPSPPLGHIHGVVPGPTLTSSRLNKPPPKPVGKQQPPSSKKKKKRTAFRPGQEVVEGASSGQEVVSPIGGTSTKDPDSQSIGSQASSFEEGKISINSSSSELHQVLSEDLLRGDDERDDDTGSLKSKPADGDTPICPQEQTPSSTVPTETPMNHEETKPPSLSSKKGAAVSGKSTVEATVELVDTSSDNKQHKPKTTGDNSKLKGKVAEADVTTTRTSPDIQLLAEVFVESERVEEREKEREQDKKDVAIEANYEVELTPSDKLTALLQSSESNLGNIRYPWVVVFIQILY